MELASNLSIREAANKDVEGMIDGVEDPSSARRNWGLKER